MKLLSCSLEKDYGGKEKIRNGKDTLRRVLKGLWYTTIGINLIWSYRNLSEN